MKKTIIAGLSISTVLLLSACSNSAVNTLTSVELTEREEAVLATTSELSFLFDFEVDDTYKELSLWLEKYEDGEFIKRISDMSSPISKEGMMIFAFTEYSDEDENTTLQNFTVGINSNDGVTGSHRSHDVLDTSELNSVWGNFSGERKISDEEEVLAYVAYSSSDNSLNSLSTGFAEAPQDSMEELNQYGVC